MFSDVVQMMTIGKTVEYRGANWMLLQNLNATLPGGEGLFLAVRPNSDLPAPVYLIAAPADIHLQHRQSAP